MRLVGIRTRGFGPFKDEVAIDLNALADAQTIAVMGANGAGKSTLLELWGSGALYRDTPTRGSLTSLATSRDAYLEATVVNGHRWTLRHMVDAVSGKGESTVLDEDGASVLESTKVRAFDAWAQKHLPPESVVYSTVFAAQKSGGFLTMKPSERKALLLRVLGIEHYERLAEAARERAREAKVALAMAETRLADERERTGDAEAIAAELAQVEAEEARAAERLESARAELAEAERRATAAIEARRRVATLEEELRARRAELTTALEDQGQIITRIRNNQAVLADEEAIRAAAARVAELQERIIPEATAAHEAARSAHAIATAKEHDIARALEDTCEAFDASKAQVDQAKKRLDELRESVAAAESELAGLRETLAEKRKAQERARAEVEERRAKLPELAGARESARGELRRAQERLAETEAAIDRLRVSIPTVQRDADDAFDALQRVRTAVETATLDLDGARSELENREADREAAAADLAELQQLVLTGKDGRIVQLRRSLEDVAKPTNELPAADIARAALQGDDALAERLADAPARASAARVALRYAEEAVREAQERVARLDRAVAQAGQLEALESAYAAKRAAVEEAGRELAANEAAHGEFKAAVAEGERSVAWAEDSERELTAGLRQLAANLARVDDEVEALAKEVADAELVLARADQVATLEKALADTRAEHERLGKRAEALRHERDKARGSTAEASEAANRSGRQLAGLREELVQLERKAHLAPRLEAAQARLAELAPQRKAADKRVADLEAEVERLTLEVAVPVPPVSDLALPKEALAACESDLRAARDRTAVLRSRLEVARAAAERVAELEAARANASEALSDWTRLAEDLGRDGLQAIEIDAAGPELTELANDLLRNCFGTRWTVSIETTRLSADGKRQLEGCELRVIDTEAGRDAAAETLSGGEQVIVGEAVSLALTMMACRRAGVDSPTLVRDESGAALSPENARAYMAMLRRAAAIVGASHVLFVSHSPEVQELADARIVVRDGRVEVEA